MDTETITLDREEARELWLKYKAHQHWSTPIDLEVQRALDAVVKGKVIVQALASITKAGLGEDNFPKLAIVRAAYDQDGPGGVQQVVTTRCQVSMGWSGGATFSADGWSGALYKRRYIELPPESFPTNVRRPLGYAEAQVPLIPIHLRPKRGLANYHVLFEAEWRRVPARDPLLLRRVGRADLWIVCAAWDLTEIERAVLAGRL